MYTASPAGSPRRFSGGLVEEGLRRFFLTLWNTYSFFVSYANIDNLDPAQCPRRRCPGDRSLAAERTQCARREGHRRTRRLRADERRPGDRTFVDDLSNWYVRRSRRRFWRGVAEGDSDKQSAYHTLYSALVTVSKLLAPFTPFIAEELYQNLVRSIDPEAPESVHLAAWPVADTARDRRGPQPETQLLKRVASLGRSARARSQIKVRQPVAEVARLAAHRRGGHRPPQERRPHPRRTECEATPHRRRRVRCRHVECETEPAGAREKVR